MKRFTLLAVLVLLLAVAALNAQTVNVTFLVNTAAVPDTLGPNSVVQLRGSGGDLTWDGGSAIFLHNVGGDYWQGTYAFPANTTIEYKFYTNAEHDTVYAGAGWEHQGWEGDLAGGNRQLVLGGVDTTLDLQFVNGWKQGATQFEAPYETNDTTAVVYVRVNMQGWDDFNPNTQVIGLRGSNTSDWGETGDISWGTTYPLTRETNHVNGGSQRYSGGYFYSGAVHVPNTYIGGSIQYKVVVHNAGADLSEDWGNMVYNSDHQDVVRVSADDTTAHWFWFDDHKPIIVNHQDTVIVNFQADMSKAITNRGFAYGDTIEVRSGYFGTASAVSIKQMVRQGFTNIYAATDTIISSVGSDLDYQYYLIKNGIEYREVYYNFYYAGQTTGEAERRAADISSKSLTVQDISDSQTDLHRMPLFRNTQTLSQDVLVTFTCDVRPAIYQLKAGATLDDIQGNLDISDPDSVMILGAAINGPASGGWGTWGPGLMSDAAHQMFDDGTNGDAVAGDSIFTLQIQFYKDSTNNVIGQEFKFGIGGGDNEGGKGGYGNNHIENIDDTQNTYTIASQFGSINPAFYSAWDYDNQGPSTGVEEDGIVPYVFSLQNNYPNPFNPETTIRYTLGSAEKVNLAVYDMLGRKIATLVNANQKAGAYTVRWTGKDDAGRSASSGMYIYRIEAGSFKVSHKMVLMK
ncbi:T9SS type A sorting domain-containing protein [bacterium]|nr:T9SS type A sorting domain-containing protein [bacterium]